MAEDAVRWTSEEITAYLRSFPGGSPADAVAHFVDLWRQTVVSSGGAAGCPLAGVALDTAGDQALLALIRREFTAWVDVLVEQLVDAGLAKDRATSIAWLTLASMEGSLILCRATGDSAPLEAAAGELQRLVSEAGNEATGGHQLPSGNPPRCKTIGKWGSVSGGGTEARQPSG